LWFLCCARNDLTFAMKEYENMTLASYSYIFNFESEFVHQDSLEWMLNNWKKGFIYVALYVIVIFGGQSLMKNKQRYELRPLLVIWNTALALFSIIGACRTLPEMVHTLSNYGLYYSCCVPSYAELDRVSGFWTFLFVLSKLPELGDTVFIVLRKQPLIFLHWYHHVTVLLYSWFSYSETTASARWFIVMNYCVHALMYSYYALRAMRYNPPRQIAMLITSLQLLQMIVGCAINIWVLQLLNSNVTCRVTYDNIKYSLIMYTSYAILFAHFFYRSYFSSVKHKKPRVTETNGTSNGKAKVH